MSLFGKQKDDAELRMDAGSPAGAAEGRARGAKPPGQGSPGASEGDGQVANIGKSITIRGDLSGSEDLVIEGSVDGKVELPEHQVTVGANGCVRAEIHAKSVVVIGKVTGNIRGSERIEIQATGSVEGDVSAPRLVVAEGAQLNGTIEMGAGGGPAPARSEQAEPTELAAQRKAG